MDIKELSLDECYQLYWDLTAKLLETKPAVALAGLMTAQAMSIYKTVMSEEDFNRMVDTISAMRDKVKPIDTPSIQ